MKPWHWTALRFCACVSIGFATGVLIKTRWVSMVAAVVISLLVAGSLMALELWLADRRCA